MAASEISLTEHVLYCIAKQVIGTETTVPLTDLTRQTLFNLRLACKHFAGMGNIKKALFRDTKIKFYAMRDDMERLQQGDFPSSLAPYVQHLTFVASPFCTTVTLAEFEDLLLLRRVHMADTEPLKYHSDPLFHARGYMFHHWQNRHPVPYDQVTGHYRVFQERAREDEAIVKSGELARTWIKALAGIYQVKQLSISATVRCLTHVAAEPGGPDYACADYLRAYTLFTARSSDLLFGVVMDFLAANKVQTDYLFINCSFGDPLADGREQPLQQVQFPGLKKMYVEQCPADGLEDESVQEPLWTDMLAKTQESIQDMRIGGSSRWLMYSMPSSLSSGISFPCLRDLRLNYAHIHTGLVANFIQQSPNLEYLRLEGTMHTGESDDWRSVFTSIKAHKKLAEVDLQSIWIHGSVWSYRLDMDEYREWSAAYSSEYEDIQGELIDYIAAGGQWTETLQMLFS